MQHEPWLLHARVFDDVHVVKPDILHTASEVATSHQRLAGLQEVVDSTHVDLLSAHRTW